MDEIIKGFKSYGNIILSSPLAINNSTIPINCSSEIFLKACNFALQDKYDKEVIAGICFNLSPYISKKFESEKEEEFWIFLIHLSEKVIDFPIIYGYLEAVTELSIKSTKISDEYLFFLSNPEMTVPNANLKPLILTALYDYLPRLYIFDNTEYFLPLVLESFQIPDFLYRSNFLLLLSRMSLNIEIITSIPDFSNLIWNFIYETSLSDINFPVLSKPLEGLRELVPDFFEMPNEVIPQKLQIFDEGNILGLIRLLPYVIFDDFQNIFQMLLEFVSSNIFVSPKLNDAVSDSLNGIFSDQSVSHMFSILSTNLLRNFDDVSIYIYSLYFPLFEDTQNDPGLFLIKSINLAFSSAESDKSILCFAIYQIAEQYKTRSRMLRNSVIPSLIETFTLNNDSCSKYASKAFIKLYQTSTILPSAYLNDYLQKFDEIINSIPDYSLYSLKKYFKVLYTIVALKNEDDIDEKKDIYDESIIFDFVKHYILDENLTLAVQAFLLELCTSLNKSFPSQFEQLTEIASSLAIKLLESDIPYSYPIAAEYILFSEDFDSLEQVFQRLIEISEGNVTKENKFIRVTSYYTAIISSQNEGFGYPIEIINKQLSSQDYIYQSRAITNLQYVFPQYEDKVLSELMHRVIQLAKTTSSSVVVDNTFILLKQLIKEKTEFAIQFALDLIMATIQGRIALLDHNFPYNYDHSKFKFFKCVTSFIKHYNQQENDLKFQLTSIIIELIDWIPIAAEEILPQIIKSVNRAIEVCAVPADEIPKLWHYLLKKLEDLWRNTDLANYLLGCLVNMLVTLPDICDSKELMDQMNHMWEEKDDEMVLILPPIFLDIWSNTNTEITTSLFRTFVDITLKEQCNDWSYPLILNFFAKIIERDEELDPDVIIDSALVFANFIFKDEENKEKLEIDEELNAKMIHALIQCNLKCEMVKGVLLDKYKRYPEKIDKLSQLFDTDF